MKLPLPCIVCGDQPEPSDKRAAENRTNGPYRATAFTSHGHYGSTVFDPMDGTYLEINVCDGCLQGRHQYVGTGQDMRRRMEEVEFADGLKQVVMTGMDPIPYSEQDGLRPWKPEEITEVIDGQGRQGAIDHLLRDHDERDDEEAEAFIRAAKGLDPKEPNEGGN